jgi:hypothetical protein
MNLYIVNQNPQSNYNDKEGVEYEFPTKIPNGKNIKTGDKLIFNLSKKVAQKLNLSNCTITGIARVDKVVQFQIQGKEMAKATYTWYKKFQNNISFEDIGGDIRNNKTNSINKVPVEQSLEFLLSLLKIQ